MSIVTIWSVFLNLVTYVYTYVATYIHTYAHIHQAIKNAFVYNTYIPQAIIHQCDMNYHCIYEAVIHNNYNTLFLLIF